MQVFNLYFKMLRKNLKVIVMYIVIFSIIFFTFAYVQKTEVKTSSYEAVQVNIAITDHDQSNISRGLIEFLDERTNIIDIKDDEQSQKDALFYDQVAYIVTIPEGFESSFYKGEGNIETQQKPDSVYAYLIEQYITSYLDNTRIYMEQNPLKSVSEINMLVREDFQQQVEISLFSGSEPIDQALLFDQGLKSTFFDYLSYMFLSIIILCVGMIMIELNKKEVRMRNIASPLKITNYNAQLLIANLCFCSLIWFIFMIAVVLMSTEMLDTSGLLYMLNAYVFMLVCLGLSYLISALLSNVKNADDALQGITQIAALGSAFVCGAFIPQAVLGQGVLMFASCTPTYWYVRFNDELRSITDFSWDGISNIISYLGIEILFAITFLILALVVNKSKRSSQQL